jgi:hypothetical protein
MHPLFRLLVLLHLAGLLPQVGQNAPSTASKGPSKGSPQAQGMHGMGQGFQGSLAPATGGLGSAKNTAGLHQHQQNPFLMMAMQQRPKL